MSSVTRHSTLAEMRSKGVSRDLQESDHLPSSGFYHKKNTRTRPICINILQFTHASKKDLRTQIWAGNMSDGW